MQVKLEWCVMKEKEFSFKYKVLSIGELSADLQHLVEESRRAVKGSYAPYSKFSVGAAVLLEDGTVVLGSNQENVAYPSGLCAERTAMFSANANYPDKAPVALAISAWTEGAWRKEPITPCGACRQVLSETEQRFGKDIKLLLCGSEDVVVIERVKDLIPLAFDF